MKDLEKSNIQPETVEEDPVELDAEEGGEGEDDMELQVNQQEEHVMSSL